MYSSFSESTKILSPIYHVNRSLVELSVDGKSDYILTAVLYLLAIALVSIVVGCIITVKKREV